MSTQQEFALTRAELYERVWFKPLSLVASELGLSGNALTKICNRLWVPYPPRGHWAKASVGKKTLRPPLPDAPEDHSSRITISAAPSRSRRIRTRLNPATRRTQLIEIARSIILEEGMHAASMKRIAARANISETQAYNYFGSREKLFVELARSETAQIQAAQKLDIAKYSDHFQKVVASTRTYLRQADRRGGLLQILLSNPEVRAVLRAEHRKRDRVNLHAYARHLVKKYDASWELAMSGTAVLSRLCTRTGKLIADRRISLAAAERLCLAIVIQGSHTVLDARNDAIGRTQRVQTA